jgi:hypothetical protein
MYFNVFGEQVGGSKKLLIGNNFGVAGDLTVATTPNKTGTLEFRRIAGRTAVSFSLLVRTALAGRWSFAARMSDR